MGHNFLISHQRMLPIHMPHVPKRTVSTPLSTLIVALSARHAGCNPIVRMVVKKAILLAY